MRIGPRRIGRGASPGPNRKKQPLAKDKGFSLLPGAGKVGTWSVVVRDGAGYFLWFAV